MEGIVEFGSDWAILELGSCRLIAKGGFALGFRSKTSLKQSLFSNSKLDLGSKIGFPNQEEHFLFFICWDEQDLVVKWCHNSGTSFFMPWTQILV